MPLKADSLYVASSSGTAISQSMAKNTVRTNGLKTFWSLFGPDGINGEVQDSMHPPATSL
jgi:hypothetical protein